MAIVQIYATQIADSCHMMALLCKAHTYEIFSWFTQRFHILAYIFWFSIKETIWCDHKSFCTMNQINNYYQIS